VSSDLDVLTEVGALNISRGGLVVVVGPRGPRLEAIAALARGPEPEARKAALVHASKPFAGVSDLWEVVVPDGEPLSLMTRQMRRYDCDVLGFTDLTSAEDLDEVMCLSVTGTAVIAGAGALEVLWGEEAPQWTTPVLVVEVDEHEVTAASEHFGDEQLPVVSRGARGLEVVTEVVTAWTGGADPKLVVGAWSELRKRRTWGAFELVRGALELAGSELETLERLLSDASRSLTLGEALEAASALEG
jgi:hypothetical protein